MCKKPALPILSMILTVQSAQRPFQVMSIFSSVHVMGNASYGRNKLATLSSCTMRLRCELLADHDDGSS